MDISRHAIKRIRNKLGINKSAVERYVEDAIANGLPPKAFSGKLRKHLDYLARQHHGTYIVTPNALFCFKGDVLATAYPLPHKFHAAVVKVKEENLALSEKSS